MGKRISKVIGNIHTPVETKSLYGGTQKVYKFENGYGVSVVRHWGSYGSKQGLWELAVIKFDDKGIFDLVYDTPITSDVMGNLSELEVEHILDQIVAL